MITRTFLLLLTTTIAATAQPLPQVKSGQCPSGYYQSGDYCAPMHATKRDAVPKTGQCPAGYSQSGNYCLEMRRPDGR
jgi:hypothetical protein